jgi:hypothetical protein
MCWERRPDQTTIISDSFLEMHAPWLRLEALPAAVRQMKPGQTGGDLRGNLSEEF